MSCSRPIGKTHLSYNNLEVPITIFFFPRQAAFDAEDENDIIDTQILLEKFWEREVKDGGGKDAMQWRRASGSADKRKSWDSWLKYGVAAAAIGVGVCYSLIRQ